MRIYKRTMISASHKLSLPYSSPCSATHGHNYLIEVWVEGEPSETGIVIDFMVIKRIVNKYDHCHLNDLLQTNPTAENLASIIAQEIKNIRHDVTVRVRVWETKDCYAECCV